MLVKTCSKCKVEKKLCDFVKDHKRKSGVRSICMVCESKRVKEFYYLNKSDRVEKQKDYVKKIVQRFPIIKKTTEKKIKKNYPSTLNNIVY